MQTNTLSRSNDLCLMRMNSLKVQDSHVGSRSFVLKVALSTLRPTNIVPL